MLSVAILLCAIIFIAIILMGSKWEYIFILLLLLFIAYTTHIAAQIGVTLP